MRRHCLQWIAVGVGDSADPPGVGGSVRSHGTDSRVAPVSIPGVGISVGVGAWWFCMGCCDVAPV